MRENMLADEEGKEAIFRGEPRHAHTPGRREFRPEARNEERWWLGRRKAARTFEIAFSPLDLRPVAPALLGRTVRNGRSGRCGSSGRPPPRNRVQLRPRAPDLWAGPTAGRAEMRRKLRETREGPSRHHPSREESWERETPHIQLPASPESSYATEFCGRLPSLPGQREARKTWRGCRQDLAPRWRRPPASGIHCYGHTRSNAPRAEAGASRLARVQRAVRARMRARQPRADAGDRALFCIPGA
jgi:hypothetical protein